MSDPPEGTLTHLPSSADGGEGGSTPGPEGTLTHAPSSSADTAPAAPLGTLTHFPSSESGPSVAEVPAAPVGTLTHFPSSAAASGGSAEERADAGTPLPGGTLAPPGVAAVASAAGGVWQVGQVLEGLYEVRGLLGQGGMGAVHRVHHLEWGIDLAVKSPLPHLFANPDALARFQREAETWIDLGLHPHIARCYYVREVQGLARIFVEYAGGGTLKEWLETRRNPNDWRTIFRLAFELLDGLAYAHSCGLVHRDVKPANCLLSNRGTLRVTDFGLVKLTGERDGPIAAKAGKPDAPPAAGVTHFEAGMGTPEYAAPEQWSSATNVDARADVYSFGVLLWELVTGRRPFDEPGKREPPMVLVNRHCFSDLPALTDHRADVPAGLSMVLRRLLAKEPERRPASLVQARALLADVYRSATGETAPAVAGLPYATAAAHCNRALSLRDLGQLEAARETWEQALRVEPHHPESTYDLGLTRWRRGEVTDLELVDSLEEMRRIHERAWIDELLLARVHLERGDAVAAREVFEEIPAEARERREVQDVLSAIEARSEQAQEHGHPLPRYDADSTLLGGWTDERVLLLFDPINRMGNAPSFTLYDRAGKRVSHTELPLPAREVGRTALASPRCIHLGDEGVVAGSLSGLLRVWSLEGDLVRELKHPGPIQALAVRPKGKRALVGLESARDKSGHAVVWDLTTGKRLGLNKHASAVRALAFGQGGEAWSACEQELVVWEQSTGKVRGRWKIPGLLDVIPLWGVGGRVVLVRADGAWIWERATGKWVQRLGRRAHRRKLSREGELLIELDGHDVRLWDLHERFARCVRTIRLKGQRRAVPTDVVVDEDAATLWAEQGAGRPLLRVPLTHLRQPHKAPLVLAQIDSSEAALSRQRTFERHLDGMRRVLAAGDVVAAVQRVGMARTVGGFARHPQALEHWRQLARITPRQGLRSVWEVDRVREGCPAPRAPECAFSPSGSLLAISLEGFTSVYEVTTREVVFELDGPQALPQFQGERYLRIGRCLWDLQRGVLEREFEGSDARHLVHDRAARFVLGTPGPVLWDREGRALALPNMDPNSARLDPAVILAGGQLAIGPTGHGKLAWLNVASGAVEESLTICSGAATLRVVVVDPTGTLVVVGGGLAGAPFLEVWDGERRQRVVKLDLHGGGPVIAAAVSPDARTLLLAQAKGGLALWDLPRAALVRELPRQSPAAQQVLFSPDGQTAASVSRDGVTLWHLDWDLAEAQPERWSPVADAYLYAFVREHLRPELETLNDPLDPVAVGRHLRRVGPVAATESDLRALLSRLGAAGMGGVDASELSREFARVGEGVAESRIAPPLLMAALAAASPRRSGRQTRPRVQAGDSEGRPTSRGLSRAAASSAEAAEVSPSEPGALTDEEADALLDAAFAEALERVDLKARTTILVVVSALSFLLLGGIAYAIGDLFGCELFTAVGLLALLVVSYLQGTSMARQLAAALQTVWATDPAARASASQRQAWLASLRHPLANPLRSEFPDPPGGRIDA